MSRTKSATAPSTPQAAPEPTGQSHQNAGATPSEPSKHQMNPAMVDTFELVVLLSKMQGLVDLGLIVDQNLIRSSDDPHILAFANLLYVLQDYLGQANTLLERWEKAQA